MGLSITQSSIKKFFRIISIRISSKHPYNRISELYLRNMGGAYTLALAYDNTNVCLWYTFHLILRQLMRESLLSFPLYRRVKYFDDDKSRKSEHTSIFLSK